MSVTPLGSSDGPAVAAKGIVKYLEGHVQAGSGQRARFDPERTVGAPPIGVAGYYADSLEAPGRWIGSGLGSLRREGPVDANELQALLTGTNPDTAVALIAAKGSATRAHATRPTTTINRGPADELLTTAETALVLGVNPSYVRRLAERHAAHEAAVAAAEELDTSPVTILDGQPGNDGWRFRRADVEAFAGARRQPAAVVGYDVTFSVPKSVSLLWAITDDPDIRDHVTAALDHAVRAGVEYLEANAAWVRTGPVPTQTAGLLGAAYLHATNRNLEPQLHTHVVIANAAMHPNGTLRALDGRGLFLHATTAGHLAAAELRHQLSDRLGVEWTPVENGLAEIVHIPDDAIRVFSSRAAEIDTLTAELGSDSASARQVAAYQTRAPKRHGVDLDALQHRWNVRAAETGLTVDHINETVMHPDRPLPTPFTPSDTARLYRVLVGPDGVTKHRAVFDRRDVIQSVAGLAGDRFTAQQVIVTADAWLATPDLVRLESTEKGHAIRRRDGTLVATRSGEPLYTTRQMLALENGIVAAFDAGHNRGAAFVPADIVDTAIASARSLGDDQAGLVRAMCMWPDRYQCAVGPAGSGKTFALTIAHTAFTDAGYSVVGAAVNGNAAEILQRSTGIPTRTLAWWLTRLDTTTPNQPILDTRTVFIVDEASTVSTRDFHRLLAHVETAGATLRMIGDPAQHGAVEAGAMFGHLVHRYPTFTPELTVNRRQKGPETLDLRDALVDFRDGRIGDAWARLDAHQRLVTAPTPAELLDTLAADWYVDRQHHQAHPDTVKPSAMLAQHHTERTALNRRARALLRSDGTLTGPDTEIGGQTFAVGDSVISRAATRLRPTGGTRRSEVRNGTRGTITAIHTHGAKPELEVDFDNRGPIRVPTALLTKPVRGRRIVGVLTHAYCLTTHAAQGDTYATGRLLASDASTREGVYVGLTRGESDARVYVVSHDRLDTSRRPDDLLPRIERDIDPVAAAGRRLDTHERDSAGIEYDVGTP